MQISSECFPLKLIKTILHVKELKLKICSIILLEYRRIHLKIKYVQYTPVQPAVRMYTMTKLIATVCLPFADRHLLHADQTERCLLSLSPWEGSCSQQQKSRCDVIINADYDLHNTIPRLRDPKHINTTTYGQAALNRR